MSAEPPEPRAQPELVGEDAARSEQVATRSESAVADSVRVAVGRWFGLEPQVGS